MAISGTRGNQSIFEHVSIINYCTDIKFLKHDNEVKAFQENIPVLLKHSKIFRGDVPCLYYLRTKYKWGKFVTNKAR